MIRSVAKQNPVDEAGFSQVNDYELELAILWRDLAILKKITSLYFALTDINFAIWFCRQYGWFYLKRPLFSLIVNVDTMEMIKSCVDVLNNE